MQQEAAISIRRHRVGADQNFKRCKRARWSREIKRFGRGTVLACGLALTACGEAGPPVPEGARDTVRALQSGTPAQRREAAAALAGSESPGVAGPLLDAARGDRDVRVRAAAVRAVATPAVLPNPAPLVEMVDDPEQRVRLAVVEVLPRYSTADVAAALTHAMNDASPPVRLAAFRAAGEAGGGVLLDVLAERAGGEHPVQERIAALQALGRAGDRSRIPVPIAAVSDKDAGVRRAAVEAVGRLGTSADVTKLIEGINEGVAAVARIDAIAAIGGDAGVTGLLTLLERADTPVRDAAAVALARISGTGGPARGRLETILRDPAEPVDVRLLVLQTLLAKGTTEADGPRDPGLRSILTDLLDDAQPRVRIAAAGALTKSQESAEAGAVGAVGAVGAGGTTAIDTLIELARSNDPATRDAAIVALTDDAVGGGTLVPAVPRLSELLGDASAADHRARLAAALGRSGDAAAVEPLVKVLRDRDQPPPVQQAVVQALAALGDPRAGAAILEHWRATGDDGLIRVMGDVRAKEAVGPLIERVRQSMADGRRVTDGHAEMEALGKIGDARAVDVLIERMRRGSQRFKRHTNYTTQAGLTALGRLGDAKAIPLFDSLIHNPPKDDVNNRSTFTHDLAIAQLANMPQPEAARLLVGYLADPAVSQVVKQGVIGPALLTAGERAKAPLLDLLQRDGFNEEADPGVFAAQMLPLLGVPVMEDLRAVVESDPPEPVLRRVIVGLEASDPSEAAAATTLLITLLQHENPPVRKWAAVSLGKHGDAAALPPLRAAAADPDAEVAKWAKWAIAEITKRSR